jgi:hypothetical protein
MFKRIFWIVVIVNYFAINYCVSSGAGLGDVSLLFQEHQPITFVSAFQLGLTALIALFIFILGRMLYKKEPGRLRLIKIWAISAAVFTFAVIDEYFMVHEGIDGGIATLFFGITENPHLDGVVLGLYGVGALFLFFSFREEIFRYKGALLLFLVGGVFFLVSIMLDIGSTEEFRIVMEESAKLIAVAFFLLGHVSILIEHLRKVDARLS